MTLKADSLVPLSGLDDLVIHLFPVDPEKQSIFLHHHNEPNMTKGEHKMWDEVKRSHTKSQDKHYAVHLPTLTLGPLGPGSPFLPCGPWGP